LQDKIEIIAKEMYKAAGVSYSPEAEAQVGAGGGEVQEQHHLHILRCREGGRRGG
jgi:formyltetrahydrofolate synthetase